MIFVMKENDFRLKKNTADGRNQCSVFRFIEQNSTPVYDTFPMRNIMLLAIMAPERSFQIAYFPDSIFFCFQIANFPDSIFLDALASLKSKIATD